MGKIVKRRICDFLDPLKKKGTQPAERSGLGEGWCYINTVPQIGPLFWGVHALSFIALLLVLFSLAKRVKGTGVGLLGSPSDRKKFEW